MKPRKAASAPSVHEQRDQTMGSSRFPSGAIHSKVVRTDPVEDAIGWLAACAVLFIAVWRVLLWRIVSPWLESLIIRIGRLFGVPKLVVRLDFTAITLTLSVAVVILIVCFLAHREPTVRQRAFWQLSAPLVVFLAIAGLSRFWSVVPDTTDKRFVYLAAVSLGGLFIGLRFKRSRILLFWELASVLMLVGSYVLLLRHPEWAIDTEYDPAGAWRGLLKYKGYAGTYMAFATTVFLLRLFQGKRISRWRQVLSFCLAGLSMLMVYKAMSATGQIALLAALGVFGLGGAWIRWGDQIPPKARKALAMGGALLVLLTIAGAPLLIQLVGRDISLTGRLPLWQAILDVVRERPALGWGFGEAFWLSKHVWRVWEIIPWKPGSAHSGLVEVLLDTGVVGAVAMAGFLATTLVLAFSNVRHERSVEALVFLAWLPLVLMANVGENLLGTYELVFWLVCVIVFSHSTRSAIDRRERPTAVPLQLDPSAQSDP